MISFVVAGLGLIDISPWLICNLLVYKVEKVEQLVELSKKEMGGESGDVKLLFEKQYMKGWQHSTQRLKSLSMYVGSCIQPIPSMI